MYYTWGYIKENTLNKLNLSEQEANEQGFLSRFPYYANEAMTQICSAIKPKETYKEITILSQDECITFDDDFVAFSDDVAYKRTEDGDYLETDDEIVEYVGYNQIIFHEPGVYRVPYKARWYFFTKDLQNYEKITAPADICDAIPSYIVSQCLKIDDEAKAAIYRNEYEMFLSRIDDTTFKSQRTLKVSGGW